MTLKGLILFLITIFFYLFYKITTALKLLFLLNRFIRFMCLFFYLKDYNKKNTIKFFYLINYDFEYKKKL